MKYTKTNYLLTSPLGKVFRLFLFLILVTYLISQLFTDNFSDLSMSLILILFMLEIFLKFKMSKQKPTLKVSQIEENEAIKAVTLKGLKLLFSSQKTFLVVSASFSSIKFLLKKIEVEPKELVNVFVEEKEILRQAYFLTKEAGGEYITEIDLFTAYLILTEEKTKLLFKKELNLNEIKDILYWAKSTFYGRQEPLRVRFSGEGIAESWAYGWTIETKKYATDLTKIFLNKEFVFTEREKEYERLKEGLSSNKSILLIGEPGSGKQSLIGALASESFSGKLKGRLYHQRIYQLMVDTLLAGSQTQGDFEKRLDQLISELAHSGNIIILIENLETVLGSSSFKLDLSATLTPYIERGVVRFIATSTNEAFKKYIEEKHELLSYMEVIKVEEPDKKQALKMIFNKASWIENNTGTTLTYRAVVKACELADIYSKDLVLPGSAVLLLKDSIMHVRELGRKIIEEEDVLNQVKSKTNAMVGEPTREEKNLLLNLESEIHKKVIDQTEAVSLISEAIRRLRSGIADRQKPISFLFLGPTGVGKTETAKALASVYYGDEEKMIRLDMSEYATQESAKRLLGSMPGEENEKGELTDRVYDNPCSLILLDEFEKADSDIHNLFLQVLDDGRLTDNKGKTISFDSTIIIATSNAASEFIREEIEKGAKVDNDFKQKLLEFLQTKNLFKPELLNRFDEIIIFKPLGEEEVVQISNLLLGDLTNKLEEKDIHLKFDKTIMDKILKEGVNSQFGARPLRRYIQDNLEDLIANKLLKEEIKRGDHVFLTVDGGNQIVARVDVS